MMKIKRIAIVNFVYLKKLHPFLDITFQGSPINHAETANLWVDCISLNSF